LSMQVILPSFGSCANMFFSMVLLGCCLLIPVCTFFIQDLPLFTTEVAGNVRD
jgi:hypothetical protein